MARHCSLKLINDQNSTLKIAIAIYNFDDYTCPHICTLLRYHHCSVPHQVNNHELKLYQI